MNHYLLIVSLLALSPANLAPRVAARRSKESQRLSNALILMMFLPAVAILLFIYEVTSKATLGPDNVSFQRAENDLPWPLPDLFDPGQLIYHGVHCYMQIQEFKDTDEKAVQHRRHCRHSVARAVRYMEKDPDYFRASKWTCDLLEENRRLAKAHYQTFDVFDYYRPPSPAPPDYLFLSDQTDVRPSSSNSTNPIAPAQDQYHAYVILATKNFADLLYKKLSNPGSLNKAEREYLEQLESDYSIAFQASGLYCRVGGKVSEIRKVISESGTRDKDPIEGFALGP